MLELSNVTIGVLTVLPEEFEAVCRVLGCSEERGAIREGSGRIYKLGVIKYRAGAGSHVIAVAQPAGMGLTHAAIRATLLVQDCPNVKNILICGIAGAVPDHKNPQRHVRLGDLVVGTEGVRQYDLVKESETYSEVRSKQLLASADLCEVAKLLEAEALSGARPWDDYIVEGARSLGAEWERPSDCTDVLREPVNHPIVWKSLRGLAKLFGRTPTTAVPYPVVNHPRDDQRIAGRPRVFHGLIACANILQKNPHRRNQLRDSFAARAIEMEGSGIAEAAHQLNRPSFVVRATCDYCNEDKNDDWHKYAALVAAAYTRALIEGFPPRYLGAGLVTTAPASSHSGDIAVQPLSQPQPPSDAEIEAMIANSIAAYERRATADIALQEAAPPSTEPSYQEVKAAVRFAASTAEQPVVSPSSLSGIATVELRQGRVRSAEVRSGTPGSAALAPPALEDVAMLEDFANSRLTELERLSKVWEFVVLQQRALDLLDWIRKYGGHVGADLRRQIYAELVRYEIMRARRDAIGVIPDLSTAKALIDEAKNGA